jgi:deoxyribonuclease-4
MATNSAKLPTQFLGAHVSTSGGVQTAFDRAEKLGINTFQFFVKNNHQWFAKSPLSEEEIAQFKTRKKEWSKKTGGGPIVAHACYLLNLGTADEEMRRKTEESYLQELTRADQLEVDYLVFHPGNHAGNGEEAAITNVARTLDKIHRATPNVNTLSVVELTAGQGTSIGCTFEQIAQVLEKVEEPKRMGVCLDTCHMFAAGYDIRSVDVWNETFKKFESIIGFDRLVCIHTNDSKKGLGSRVDRHEELGEGEIGLEAFRLLVNDPRMLNIPKILETPKDEEMAEDFINLEILAKLIGKEKVSPSIRGIWKNFKAKAKPSGAKPKARI